MAADYLHNHKDFPQLLRIIGRDTGIDPYLIEKDYWIMHVLYGLQQLKLGFELKGGTSLSKAYKIIDRFSEDIDIHINPPAGMQVSENPKHQKTKDVQSRKTFFDDLAELIKVDGITSVVRDTDFDDEAYYRSGGIRLFYPVTTLPIEGIKDGILLEAGFDTVTPNQKISISSWGLDRAISVLGIQIINNTAIDVNCYHPGYTFVEKLQTIATKYRNEMSGKTNEPNFMRQYYDVYCLLDDPQVQAFIGSSQYQEHKQERFPKPDLAIPVAENQAFLLEDDAVRAAYISRYERTKNLYYKGQPPFEAVLEKIRANIDKL
jgi:hypothetical protein